MSTIDLLRTALYGDPPSIDFEPEKSGVLAAFEELVRSLDTVVGGIAADDTAVYASKTTLESHLEFPDRTLGLVYAAGDPDANGIYIKSGAIDTGAWVFTGLLARGPGIEQVDFDAAIGSIESTISAIEARTIAGSGLVTITGGGTLGDNNTITVTAPTQAEAEAGAIATVAMTPQRTTDFFNYRTSSYTRSFLQLTGAAAIRADLDLVAGEDIQVYSLKLKNMALAATQADEILYFTGADTVSRTVLTTFGRTLINDVSAAEARATLALGGLSVLNSVNDGQWSGTDLSIANGGTGASTAAAARANFGLVPGTDVQVQSARLQALANAAPLADEILYYTGSNTVARTSLTTFGRTLINDTTAAEARATLAVVIGTNVQAQSARLQALADAAPLANEILYYTGSNAVARTPLTTFARTLINDATAAEARQTLRVEHGVDVQPYSDRLQSISNLSAAAGKYLYFNSVDNLTTQTISTRGRSFVAESSQSGMRGIISVFSEDEVTERIAAAVDSVTSGVDQKDAARLVAVADLDLDGAETIDLVATENGDRVLVLGQTDPIENGIYIVNHSGAWTRADGELLTGATWRIDEGTLYSGSLWRLDDAPDAVGTDPVVIRRWLTSPTDAYLQQMVNPKELNPLWFNDQIGDGLTEASETLQECFDEAEAIGASVKQPTGIYSLENGLRIKSLASLRGAGIGGRSDVAGPHPNPATEYRCQTADINMIRLCAETAGEWLWGFDFNGIYLNGNSLAARLMLIQSCRFTTIDAWGSRARLVGFDVTDGNGAVDTIPTGAYVHFPNVYCEAGGNVSCEGMIGLYLHQDMASTGNGVTRTTAGRIDVTGGAHGAGFKIGNHDAGHFDTVYADVRDVDNIGNPSTGHGMWYEGVGGDQPKPSRKNVNDNTHADIYVEDETRNDAGLINSEPSNITIPGNGQLSYRVLDRNTGRVYAVPDFAMRHRPPLAVSSASPFTGTPANGTIGGAGIFKSLVFANGAVQSWTIPFGPFEEWDEGLIKAVEIHYGHKDGATTGAVASIDAGVIRRGTSNSYTGSPTLQNVSAVIPDTDNEIGFARIVLNAICTKDDIGVLQIRRNGDIDTLGQDLHITHIALEYISDGPHTDPGKFWDVPIRDSAGIRGGKVRKATGTEAYNAQATSSVTLPVGSRLYWRFPVAGGTYLSAIALNSDPLAGNGLTTMDAGAALNTNASGTIKPVTDGSVGSNIATGAGGQSFYFVNGATDVTLHQASDDALIYTYVGKGGAPLYVDSSFYSVGSYIDGIYARDENGAYLPFTLVPDGVVIDQQP